MKVTLQLDKNGSRENVYPVWLIWRTYPKIIEHDQCKQWKKNLTSSNDFTEMLQMNKFHLPWAKSIELQQIGESINLATKFMPFLRSYRFKNGMTLVANPIINEKIFQMQNKDVLSKLVAFLAIKSICACAMLKVVYVQNLWIKIQPINQTSCDCSKITNHYSLNQPKTASCHEKSLQW